jgi:hypothetical protein
MKPEIYFHIGQPKTGTSAIQGFLNYNREHLFREYKVLYPNFNSKDYITGLMHNHAPIFLNAIKEKKIPQCINDFVDCFNYCAGHNVEKVVISNEGFFWHWWPKILNDIIDRLNCDYKIIVYLRRQDYWVESGWKQWGHKRRDCNTIQDYIEKADLDWGKMLAIWSEYFSSSKIIVRPYEKAQIGDDVVLDFVKLIGLNDINGFSSPPDTNLNTNIGLNKDIIEILRLSKNLVDDLNDHSIIEFLNTMLSDSYKRQPMSDFSLLSPTERIDLINKFKASNDMVARQYLGREDGKLFREPLPDPDEHWEAYDGLTVEKIVPVILEILMKQQKSLDRIMRLIKDMK